MPTPGEGGFPPRGSPLAELWASGQKVPCAGAVKGSFSLDNREMAPSPEKASGIQGLDQKSKGPRMTESLTWARKVAKPPETATGSPGDS